MREEEHRKSAGAVQSELSLLPRCCSWEGREEERKEKRREEKTQGFESCV